MKFVLESILIRVPYILMVLSIFIVKVDRPITCFYVCVCYMFLWLMGQYWPFSVNKNYYYYCFQTHFLDENHYILMQISLKFGLIDSKSRLAVDWRRTGVTRINADPFHTHHVPLTIFRSNSKLDQNSKCWFKLCRTGHNDILHTSRQFNCRDVCKISL